jgi:hypothetical protein
MSFTNEAAWDRILRLVTGAALAAFWASGLIAGAPGTTLGAIGLLLVVTGVVGWCPAYCLFGAATKHDEESSTSLAHRLL